MSQQEPPGRNPTAPSLTPPPSQHPTAPSLTPPPSQQAGTPNTPLTEAPSMESASTRTHPTAATVTADRINQTQPQPPPPPQQDQPPRQKRKYSPPDQASLVTDTPPPSTFPRGHPPRDPPPRQPAPRQYDNTPPDRKPPPPPPLSSYPTAPDSLPQTPHSGMSAPSAPRARADTPASRASRLSSYPTAPISASQTPQSGGPQTPQQGVSVAGWLGSPTASPASRISFEDYLSLSEITFEWSDSYDDKDWMRLRAILAPTLMVDYSQVNGHVWSSMPAEEFVRVMSHMGFVGDPLVHTQHHIGASKWSKISDDEAIGHHQLRAAHQRYSAHDLKTVESKGHGHAMVTHFYKKVDGEWKLAGLRPMVRWNEFEFEKIFKGF